MFFLCVFFIFAARFSFRSSGVSIPGIFSVLSFVTVLLLSDMMCSDLPDE